MSQCPHIDLISPETYAGGAPLEMYRALHQQSPVSWQEDPECGGFWAITKQADMDYVSKNPDLFSSAERSCLIREFDEDTLSLVRNQLINMDPPDHIKFRRIIRNAFTPKAVDSYHERFKAIAKDIIDKIIDKGECEFVTDVAAELPLVAICELMSIPLDDRYKFFEWTNIMLGADDPDLATSEDDATMAMINVFEYGRKLAEEYRKDPQPCILGTLLDGVVEGEHLSDDEFCNFFLMLMIAGNETTRTVTTHGMRLLIEHPDQYQKLVDKPELIPDAMEELLRYNTAVIQFRRTAMQDVEVGGQLIKKGDNVRLFYQAANMDADVFDDPEVFDITRAARTDVRNQHRAFGIGQHFCLGSHLARLELQVIFDEIVGRIRNPRLNGEISWLRSNFIHGIKSMPVAFDKA